MDEQTFRQMLPGVLFVAMAAFPALCFMKRSFGVRLVVAAMCVFGFLSLFGLILGHQFTFWNRESIPLLVIGFALAWLAAFGVRYFHAAFTKASRS
jgi:hypothetical protein